LALNVFLSADDRVKRDQAWAVFGKNIADLGDIIETCSHGQANAYPVIVEWLFAYDIKTAKQLLTMTA
jgi:hypothetical protein